MSGSEDEGEAGNREPVPESIDGAGSGQNTTFTTGTSEVNDGFLNLTSNESSNDTSEEPKEETQEVSSSWVPSKLNFNPNVLNYFNRRRQKQSKKQSIKIGHKDPDEHEI